MFDCLWLQLVRMALKLDKRVYYVLAFLTVLFMFFIGSRSSPIILFVFAVCTGSMVFAIYLAKWVLAKDEGPPEMSEVLPGLGPFMVYILPIVDYGFVLCRNDVSTAVVCFAFNFLSWFRVLVLYEHCRTDLLPTWWVMFVFHGLYCTGDHIAGCTMDWTLLFFADFWCDTRWSRGFLPHSIWIHIQDGRHSCFYYSWNLSIS